jgi:phosphatidylethanolamine-binding protein (PEBP) family uncharacterized protein
MIARHRWATTIALLAVIAASALSGCGDSSGTVGGSTVLSSVEPPYDLSLRSPAVHGGVLPAAYTCDGRDVSPSFSWRSAPSGLEELALFALGKSSGAHGRSVTTIEWAVAGISPTTHRMRAGEVPHGAFVLAASDGRRRYSLCPAPGQSRRYTFALYALPRLTRVTAEINSRVLLTNLTESTNVENLSPAAGTLSVTYTRP